MTASKYFIKVLNGAVSSKQFTKSLRIEESLEKGEVIKRINTSQRETICKNKNEFWQPQF